MAEDGSINLVVETVYGLDNGCNIVEPSDNCEITMLDNNSVPSENCQMQSGAPNEIQIRDSEGWNSNLEQQESVINTGQAIDENVVVKMKTVDREKENLRKQIPVNSFKEGEARLARKLPVSKKSCTPSKRIVDKLRSKNEESSVVATEAEKANEKPNQPLESNSTFANQTSGETYLLPEEAPSTIKVKGSAVIYSENVETPDGNSTPVHEKDAQGKEYQPVVLLKYDIGHLLENYDTFDQNSEQACEQQVDVYNEVADTNEGENELNLKISAVTSLEADTEVAEAFNHTSVNTLYDEDTVSDNEWEINSNHERLRDSASVSVSDGEMPKGLRTITLRKTGHVREGLQITIKANKASSDVTFDPEGKETEADKETSAKSPETRKASLRRKKSVNYRDSLRQKFSDHSDSGTDTDQKVNSNTKKNRVGRPRNKEHIIKVDKNAQVKSKIVDLNVEKKKKGHQYKSKEFIESSESEVERMSVRKAEENDEMKDTDKMDKAGVCNEEGKPERKHKKKKRRKKSKRSEERREGEIEEDKSEILTSLEKVFGHTQQTKDAEDTVKKVSDYEERLSVEAIDETLKSIRKESESQAKIDLENKISAEKESPENSLANAADQTKTSADLQSIKCKIIEPEMSKISTEKGRSERVTDKSFTKKRVYSRSRSRSPDVSRRKRARSRSRSRSYSPYSRKGRSYRSPRRRHSRSPSPRRRRSRSPAYRRRYSRSPSPYSKGRRRGRYSPRRRYSRSPSPRSRRRSRSKSPLGRYSRSPSPGKRYSRSRSRSPPRKRFSTAPVKTGKERPYSPSSPTRSPTRAVSPTQSTKAFVEKMGRTATDELFDIAFGKAPVIHVQSTQRSSSETSATSKPTTSTTTITTVSTPSTVVDPVDTTSTNTKTTNTPPSDVLELFSPAYADNKSKTSVKATEEKSSPPKKLTISQYKSRKSIAESEGENKAKRIEEKRSSSDSSKSDDADIISIQKQYHMLKETIDNFPSDEEGKIDLMIEYKRVGEELKCLRAKHSGKSDVGTSLALPAISIVTTSVTTSVTTATSNMSPRKGKTNVSPIKGPFGKLSELGENVKPEWELNSMDPEAGTAVEKFDGYGTKIQSSVSGEKTGSNILNKIDIGNILEKLGLSKKSQGSSGVPNANSPAVQNILSLAKVHVDPQKVVKTHTDPTQAVVKPLMSQDIPAPTLRTLMNSRNTTKQPPLPPPVKPPPLPPSDDTDKPVFFTDINNTRVNSLAPKASETQGNEPRRSISRDPRIAKQISVDSATTVPRDPRISRQSSYNPDITGHSPRDQVGMTSPRGLSPRGGVSPLSGMISPTHISSRQQQQHQQQPSYYQPPLPVPLPVNRDRLPLIPIDVPEINYEGIQGVLDDPRFQPRDNVCWNERPVKHLRMIPWEVEPEIEEVEMEIVGGTEEGNAPPSLVNVDKGDIKPSASKFGDGKKSPVSDAGQSLPDAKAKSGKQESIDPKGEHRKRHASADVKQDIPLPKSDYLHKRSYSHDHDKNSKTDLQSAESSIGQVEESSHTIRSCPSVFESHVAQSQKKVPADNDATAEPKSVDDSPKFYNPKDSLRTNRNITGTKVLTNSSNYIIGSHSSSVNTSNNTSAVNVQGNTKDPFDAGMSNHQTVNDASTSNEPSSGASKEEMTLSKGSRAASRWSTMSANWHSNRNATQSGHESDSLVGEADVDVINYMATVEQYSEKWFNQLSVEMSRHLDVRLSDITEKNMYHDPTDGVTSEMREKVSVLSFLIDRCMYLCFIVFKEFF